MSDRIDEVVENLLAQTGIDVSGFKGEQPQKQQPKPFEGKVQVVLAYKNQDLIAYCLIIGAVEESEIKADSVVGQIIYEISDLKTFVEEYEAGLKQIGVLTHINPLELHIMNSRLTAIKMEKRLDDWQGARLLEAVKIMSYVIRGNVPPEMLKDYS
ncbi:hypothetical protein HYU12_04690 [Candidatus Woesearchaeota archaeon]|nr:hypothetical protein [Candidatus Woesearchaeota archaeon]